MHVEAFYKPKLNADISPLKELTAYCMLSRRQRPEALTTLARPLNLMQAQEAGWKSEDAMKIRPYKPDMRAEAYQA
ncbi:MAG: hypothetical protein JHC12_00420 [Thermogladius sp.]|nr:hypothetical protein [Thermogladius sp.]